ncbi:MAG: (deoxy)nucleoside triphosphate pyrophosphohydrolase [Novosphingobium sp.]|uniref:(deoxy)nucleoside triphosphate pyrophosphohydrolase n=1 Tax=Novosphingobium sp. TaxID=1874826 RepID=UPI0032BF1D92
MKKNPTQIEVVAIALIDAQNRVLMQRRRAGRAHAGLWEFPGGKVEPGESGPAALCREVDEELGLVVAEANLTPLAQASDAVLGIVIRLYTCRLWPGDPVCLDAQELGWFAPDGLLALDMPPLDVPLAQAVLVLLDSGK